MKKLLPLVFLLLIFIDSALRPSSKRLLAEERKKDSKAETVFSTHSDSVTFSQYDINNILSWVGTNGQIVSFVPTGGGSGLFFPKGARKTAVFASGPWVVGKVGEDLRSAAAEYTTEFVAGPFGGDSESPRNKIFRVSPLYPDGLDINGDGDFDDTFDDIRNAGISSETGEFDPWSSWPVENGAPVDANGNPDILGDGMVWMVFNDGDPAAHATLWDTAPLGIEIQTSIFGFQGLEPLANIMFIKWLIINKGGNNIDSTFVSMWSDADIGAAGDDLVGVDTLTNLGYMYNGDSMDGVYGSTPPAVGYDLFQGPVVPSPGDEAFAFGRTLSDFKNLSMTSFIQGTKSGRPFLDPDTAEEAYNLLRGFTTFGDTIFHPITNEPTKFTVTGDPVTGEGWLATKPSDRKLFLNSGPFTMTPGDSQEIVAAVILTQGIDNIDAITQLRFVDRFAQALYDNDFKTPQAISPELFTQGLDREILLTWDVNKQEVEGVDQGHKFEGYNIYQGESIAGPWKRIATFDLDNDIRVVFDRVFDPATGFFIEIPVAFGSNTGIQRFLSVKNDVFNDDQPFINNRKFYFAVTSYLVNVNGAPRVIESPIIGKAAIPHEPELGDVLGSVTGEEFAAKHTNGSADATVKVLVVNPEAVTGDRYRITFPASSAWSLTNLTRNAAVLENQRVDLRGMANNIADGFTPLVNGTFEPPATFFFAYQTVDADNRDVGLDLWGDAQIFGSATGLYSEFTGFPAPDVAILQRDLELRFTGRTLGGTVDEPVVFDGQWGTQWERDAFGEPDLSGFAKVGVRLPFELWDVENDRQVNVAVINRNADGAAPYDNGVGDPNTPGLEPRWRITGRDYFIPVMSDYDETAAMSGEIKPTDANATWLLFFQQGGSAIWTTGDVFLIQYDNPLIPGVDEFEFSTPANVRDDKELALSQLDKINVFPNPYMGFNLESPGPSGRFVRFTHLDGDVTIHIFTLSGIRVKTLEHRGESQFCEWDLRNARGRLVASGIYLVLLELKTLGAKKMLKLAVFQPEG